jgi:hypothetical protein
LKLFSPRQEARIPYRPRTGVEHTEGRSSILCERQPAAGKLHQDGRGFSNEPLAASNKHVVGKTLPALTKLSRKAQQPRSIRRSYKGCIEGTGPLGHPSGLVPGFTPCTNFALRLCTPPVETIAFDSGLFACPANCRTGLLNFGISHSSLTVPIQGTLAGLNSCRRGPGCQPSRAKVRGG